MYRIEHGLVPKGLENINFEYDFKMNHSYNTHKSGKHISNANVFKNFIDDWNKIDSNIKMSRTTKNFVKQLKLKLRVSV